MEDQNTFQNTIKREEENLKNENNSELLSTEELSEGEIIDEEDYTSFPCSEKSLSIDVLEDISDVDEEPFEVSFSSIYSYTSVKDDTDPVEEGKDVTDLIIQAFTKRPRVNFIDSDVVDALISYQESERRLIILGNVLAFILAMVSSILAIYHLANDNQPKIIVHSPDLTTYNSFPVPTIFIMDPQSGQIQLYVLTKTLEFHQVQTFQLPQSLTYFPFYHDNYLYVAYSDKRKEYVTYFDVHQKRHRNILKSALPVDFQQHNGDSHRISYGTEMAQLGSWIWIFGGTLEEVPFTMGPNPRNFYHKTCLWSLYKQKWILGPTLEEDVIYGKLVNINQTNALLLFPNLQDYPCAHCIKAYSITFHSNFSNFILNLDECYFDYVTCSDSSEWVQLAAESYVTKQLEVNWLVIVGVYEKYGSNPFHFGQFDQFGLVKNWVEYFDFDHPGLIAIKGLLYFYPKRNEFMELYQLVLDNLTLKLLVQNISIGFSKSTRKQSLIVKALV